jgi:tetratricopeptide (TPR) repeat protein
MRAKRGELFIGSLAFCLVLILGLSVAVAPTWAGHAEKYYNEGIDYSDKGQYDLAIASCKKSIRLKPDYASVHNNLARLWVSSKDPAFRRPREALAHAQKAVRFTGRKYPSYLDTLAEVHYALGQRLKATRVEEEAIHLKPGNDAYQKSLKWFVLCQEAMRAAHDGDAATARERWQAILTLAPKDWRAQEELGTR